MKTQITPRNKITNRRVFNFFVGASALCALFAFGQSSAAQLPAFNIVKPSTTGVPGQEVRVMAFDPAGNLWIGARFRSRGESGLAMLSADQLQPAPLPGGRFDTGAWRVWSSVQNPIPSPYMNGIAFGADGTTWLGSAGGLTRFRPSAAPPEVMWFTYTTANSPLVQNDIAALAQDSQGNLWIVNAGVTGGGALFKFNPTAEQWTRINEVQSPRAVTVGNNDHVFVSMAFSGGMMEFDGSTWVLRNGAPALESLLQDAQGNVWAGTVNSGLWKWNGSSWQNWPSLGGASSVTALGKDRDGVIYVSTFEGPVFKMINDQPVFFVDAQSIPGPVLGRANGDLWINNYGDNANIGRVRHYTSTGTLLARINTLNSGLPDYFIGRIKSDSAGNMWFGSGQGGLSRLLGSDGGASAANHWRNWGNYNDFSEPYPWTGNDPMYSVFEDTGGVFWMGGNGIGRWDSNTGQFTGFWNWQNSNVGTDGVKAIVKRGGTIWLGSAGSGVSWFDGTNWNYVTLSPDEYDFDANDVKAMTVDTEDNLWVASAFGLRKFAPGNNSTFTQYDGSNFPSASMLDVEADPTGGVWVATFDGLVRFNNGNITLYNQANTGMPGPVVYGVARRASDGLIAIASQQSQTTPYTGGVSTFDGTTWTHYTPDNSPLTHWQVNAVEFDARGNLWASALSEGVVQILIGNNAPALQFASAVSRKTHGAAGVFDVNLPLSGTPAVECRFGTGGHTLVFTFSNALVSGNASIASGSATIAGSPTFNGNTMTVNLTEVANAQTVTITLSDVTDTFDQVLPPANVSMAVLLGDSTGNNVVTSSDVAQTKANSGATLSQANFRSDFNLSGSISSNDVGIAKAASGGGGSLPRQGKPIP